MYYLRYFLKTESCSQGILFILHRASLSELILSREYRQQPDNIQTINKLIITGISTYAAAYGAKRTALGIESKTVCTCACVCVCV